MWNFTNSKIINSTRVKIKKNLNLIAKESYKCAMMIISISWNAETQIFCLKVCKISKSLLIMINGNTFFNFIEFTNSFNSLVSAT